MQPGQAQPAGAGICSRMSDKFRMFGRAVGGFSNAAMGLATIMLLGFLTFLMGAVVLTRVDPVLSDRLVAVKPASRFIDRDVSADIMITREICASRDQYVEITRNWAEYSPGDEPRPVRAHTSLWYNLREGCHTVSVVQLVPMTLPPGIYVYEASVRSCTSIIFYRCVTHPLVPIPVSIIGGPPPMTTVPLPPPVRDGHAPPPQPN